VAQSFTILRDGGGREREVSEWAREEKEKESDRQADINTPLDETNSWLGGFIGSSRCGGAEFECIRYGEGCSDGVFRDLRGDCRVYVVPHQASAK